MAQGPDNPHYEYTLGVPSTRPELRGHSRDTIQQYAQRQGESYPKPLLDLGRACHLQYRIEEAMFDAGLISNNNQSLHSLEKTLLDLASSGVAQATIFLILFQFKGQKILRFLESGSYLGFLHQEGLKLLRTEQAPSYRVYTPEDIQSRLEFLEQRAASIGGKRKLQPDGTPGKPRVFNRSAQTYKRYLDSMKNELQVFCATAEKLDQQDDLEICGLFTQVIRKNESTKPDDRFTYCKGLTVHLQRSLEESLQDFRVEGTQELPYDSIEALRNIESSQSLPDQYNILSALPNYHWARCPQVGSSHLRAATSRVSYQAFSAFQPNKEDKDHPYVLPSSPRNRYLYFLVNHKSSDLHRILCHIFCGPQSVDYLPAVDESSTSTNTPRTRQYARRVVKVTATKLTESMQQIPSSNSMTLVNAGLYVRYKTKQVEEGSLHWRIHDLNHDVIALNDYSPDTGELLPQSFAHVQRITDGGEIIYICTCPIYGLILSMGIDSLNPDDALSSDGTCMHCRFVKDEIEPHMTSIVHGLPDEGGPYTRMVQKLSEAFTSTNMAIVPLNKGPGTLKFSVRNDGADTCSLVHLTGGFITCQSGECQATGLKHRRSASRLLTLEEGANLCPHLGTMLVHKELWIEEDAGQDIPSEDLNKADQGILADISENKAFFNTTTKKWDFGGYSTHAPSEEHSLKLVGNAQRRMAVHDLNPLTPRKRETGCLTGVTLVPDLPEDTVCNCGAGFSNHEFPEGRPPVFDFNTTLYTRQAPVSCEVFKRECVGRQCKLPYKGEQNNIHFFTRDTCAGDEVGWDFVNAVLTSKMSFSAFCQEKTRFYRSVNVLSSSFMSKSTFVSWFFSWAARMDDDFRDHSDPWCCPNPKIVACDGTHVGLSLRRLNISGIETPEIEETIETNHKRYDRVFLPYQEGINPEDVRSARQHLKYMCKNNLSQIPADEVLAANAVNVQNTNLLLVSPQDERCHSILLEFLDETYPPEMQEGLAKLLLMLATDAPVTTVVPYRFRPVLQEVCMQINQNEVPSMQQLSFSPELQRLLTSSLRLGFGREVSQFLLYLVDFIEDLHSTDAVCPQPHPIPNSYNPESGVAYYFTNHGCKVRPTPKYAMDKAGTYDDEPCQEERCGKEYTKVSIGGWCHAFLWFCPIHGHCFGFHLIKGAEGRKDPFHSAYSYMEEPPDEVFYVFSSFHYHTGVTVNQVYFTCRKDYLGFQI